MSETTKHCFNCTHCKMPEKAIECHHPQRPEGNRVVVRWMRGCQQFQLKETK